MSSYYLLVVQYQEYHQETLHCNIIGEKGIGIYYNKETIIRKKIM